MTQVAWSAGEPMVQASEAQLYQEVVELTLAGRAVGRASVEEMIRSRFPLMPEESVTSTAQLVEARLHGLGPLEELLADPEVAEVMVNGGGHTFIERSGSLHRTDVVMSVADTMGVIDRVTAPLGLRVDRSSPLVDARLPDGSRVNIILPPIAVDGPCITIRRFSRTAIPLGAFCDEPLRLWLEAAVVGRKNIVVSGGTGAGKTTLLNALATAIGDDERIITIEDAAELRLPGSHVVRLESRPGNGDGVGAVTMRTLLRNALRMRPDRIIVGEVRGGETLEMVQAMNTGHAGSLSTVHASSPADALRRLETMMLQADVGLPLEAVRDHLHAAVDIIVQVVRGAGGGRHISSVVEVGSAGVLTPSPVLPGTPSCGDATSARPES